jgi:hypothetical protein
VFHLTQEKRSASRRKYHHGLLKTCASSPSLPEARGRRGLGRGGFYWISPLSNSLPTRASRGERVHAHVKLMVILARCTHLTKEKKGRLPIAQQPSMAFHQLVRRPVSLVTHSPLGPVVVNHTKRFHVSGGHVYFFVRVAKTDFSTSLDVSMRRSPECLQRVLHLSLFRLPIDKPLFVLFQNRRRHLLDETRIV